MKNVNKKGVLLITGGTGSFGNAVLKRALDLQFEEIRIFSRDEEKQDQMRKIVDCARVKFHIGDVRNYESLDSAISDVDYIFHAAALKQVPSCEFFPMEAIRTNINGADNLLKAATKHRVKRVVVLSTDKAVYPINAMGMTKALMEKIAISRASSAAKGGTTISVTRYGNVMASRGSVIPLFMRQIKEGRPITITDPEMTRFLMTLDQAVDLVLHAFSDGMPGDIFVQKSPAATILTIANALKELYNSSSDIKIIGTRHGEKLYETLVNREEMAKVDESNNYFRIPCDFRDLNYENYIVDGSASLTISDEYTSHNTLRLNVEETKNMLLRLQEIRRDIKV